MCNVSRDRPPVEEPPGTSDDIDSALEGTSTAFNEYTDSVNKERGRTAEQHDQPVSPGNCPERQNQRRQQKRQWSPKEVAAIMRHFKKHIAKGKLATKIDCQQCKNAEHPDLDRRSLQNIRDFVRNRGIALQKETSQ
ncbi:uncharacterized protein LOC118496400 isoform X2 [Sander lucioperca]|nr:uncharacterized protein LOC118496400 isoform X2 [Sander lucioperca]